MNRQPKFFYLDGLEKQASACKIYYLPLPEAGKFEEVPTVEYVQPEQPCWQERLMDWIGGIVLCVVIGGTVSMVAVQIAIRIWG
jgi:hypothetical protein